MGVRCPREPTRESRRGDPVILDNLPSHKTAGVQAVFTRCRIESMRTVSRRRRDCLRLRAERNPSFRSTPIRRSRITSPRRIPVYAGMASYSGRSAAVKNRRKC